MEKQNCYAADTRFPFVVRLTDGSFGCVESCGMTRMNVLYTVVVS